MGNTFLMRWHMGEMDPRAEPGAWLREKSLPSCTLGQQKRWGFLLLASGQRNLQLRQQPSLCHEPRQEDLAELSNTSRRLLAPYARLLKEP
jgi:hypothetical protein